MASSLSQTVKTRICIISDTHGSLPKLPQADLFIHCGDLTYTGRLRQLQAQYSHIAAAPAELKLVIAGNHDITLDRTYYARRGEYMHKERNLGDSSDNDAGLEDLDACYDLWISDEAKGKGIRYLEEGVSTHELSNGARFTVYSSPYQPEFCDWAFPYFRHEDRFNPPSAPGAAAGSEEEGTVYVPGAKPVPGYGEVDLMITHGPPQGVLDRTYDGLHVGCKHLLRAAMRARPLVHCFGHIHEGYGSGRMRWPSQNAETEDYAGPKKAHDLFLQELSRVDIDHGEPSKFVNLTPNGRNPLRRGDETHMVNASIMNAMYRPVQVPIVIDVDLPVRDG